jgi:carbon monoxide dehydrogenase subunit G
MRFENQFEVGSPIETVWDAVLDVERVAPTVPGAQVLERTGDDSYHVAIKVRVGPMSMTYRGQVEIAERDDQAHRAVMKARAKEARGQGTADADVVMQLRGENGRTSATVTTEVELSGKAATMGQGVLQDVAGRLVETFAKNLAAMLEGEPATAGASAEAPAAAPGAAPAEAAAPGAAPAEAAAAASEAPAAGAASPPGTAAYAPGTPAAETLSPGPAPGTPAPPRAGFEREEALDLGSLGGAVIAGRLQDPRRLAGLLGLIALVAFLLGRRSAR